LEEPPMKLLEGKNALVFGLANNRSIAWGITQAFAEHGANLGISHAGGPLTKRVEPLGEQLGLDFVEACDVASDEAITAVAEKAKAHFGEIDILVHSIGFANRHELKGAYYNTSRAGFHLAMDISVYSFVALAKAFQPFMRPGGSIMCLTYYGSVRVVPNYNVMGVAKAALEASTRYLARDFGPQGIRVNAISAGPVKTLAAAGIGGFRKMLGYAEKASPLRRTVTIEEVGNTAAFLCSDLASGITGETTFVDAGSNIMAMVFDEE
jgi:enoyl-[acyl-carrier protein] reductase I